MKSSNPNFLSLALILLSCSLICPGVIAADKADLSTLPSNVQTNTFELSAISSPISSPISSALPADSAFTLSALIELPDSIVLMWDIQEGYYLYRKSLNFSEPEGKIIDTISVPAGQYVSDEFFGDVEVYYKKLLVKIPLSEVSPSAQNKIQLQLEYQGCAEVGYCYPMQHKIVSIDLP